MILKINKIIWFLTLVAVLSVIVNNNVFIHTHILPDGRIVEQGSYETLCRQNGEFNRMVRTQSMDSIKEN